MRKILTPNKNNISGIFTIIILIYLWLNFSNPHLSSISNSDFLVKIPGQNVTVSSIMPSMPDQKAKEELGRASWKYFHTLLARFPDEPSKEEKDKLKSFIYLYAELYPCGECSYHFMKMLKKYPPQVSSRTAVALWGCHIHNFVNQHLNKSQYDCSTILEDYDCGCGDENGKISKDLKLNKVSIEKEEKQRG